MRPSSEFHIAFPPGEIHLKQNKSWFQWTKRAEMLGYRSLCGSVVYMKLPKCCWCMWWHPASPSDVSHKQLTEDNWTQKSPTVVLLNMATWIARFYSLSFSHVISWRILSYVCDFNDPSSSIFWIANSLNSNQSYFCISKKRKSSESLDSSLSWAIWSFPVQRVWKKNNSPKWLTGSLGFVSHLQQWQKNRCCGLSAASAIFTVKLSPWRRCAHKSLTRLCNWIRSVQGSFGAVMSEKLQQMTH